MKRLDKIDHIAIKVNNIEESLCWYLEKFDCKTIYCDRTWALIRFKNINLALTSNNGALDFQELKDESDVAIFEKVLWCQCYCFSSGQLLY